MGFIIGIDLGTTNCCAAFVDLETAHRSVQLFRIPQISSREHIEELETLPSFCSLDSGRPIVGAYAKHQAARLPTKVVESAKSWLCLSGANRRDKILPFMADAGEHKISPVAATTNYLAHIRDSWNQKMSKGDHERELQQQHIVITVPASFDEVARELTFEAAKKAGFSNVTLLEEPQAAFYSWINEQGAGGLVQRGQSVLVCDVGGGTTDFSWIEATEDGFRRMAVGRHLLLGGDNMDLAVAHLIENKLEAKLSNLQWQQLRHEARRVKEQAFEGSDDLSVCIQGSGSTVVGGSLFCDISGEEVRNMILSGFWRCEPFDLAAAIKKRSGVRSFGLPYEEEPSILKHLAAFFKTHQLEAPDFILFNGGTMTPPLFQEAVVSACGAWFSGKAPAVLKTLSLDLAVARGAASYGKARFGEGVKISGGISRSYYIEVDEEGEKKALAIVPREAEEGQRFELGRTFYVLPNTPVSFRLYSSHVRLGDRQGDNAPLNEEQLQALPPIFTTIRYGKSTEKIPVHMFALLTEIGTLEIWLQSQVSDHKWKLEFQLQSASGHEASYSQSESRGELLDKSALAEAEGILASSFEQFPKQMIPKLEETVGVKRSEWGPGLLRGLWPALMKGAEKRGLSEEHRQRWWQLAGFLLRPGFGVALDDHRIKELWKVILSDYREGDLYQWICYRRIAGGLSKGQQRQLAPELMKELLNKGKIQLKSKKERYPYSEKIRALAAFEFLDTGTKVKLGNAILQKIVSGKGLEADYWALGRMGARQMLYATVLDVVSPETSERWIRALLESQNIDSHSLEFALAQLARKTECREVNIHDEVLGRVAERFPKLDLSPDYSGGDLDHLYGDQLPNGLILT